MVFLFLFLFSFFIFFQMDLRSDELKLETSPLRTSLSTDSLSLLETPGARSCKTGTEETQDLSIFERLCFTREAQYSNKLLSPTPT